MLALLRAERSAALSVAERDPWISLGPSSDAGWTAMLVDTEKDVPDEFTAIFLEDFDDSVLLILRDSVGQTDLEWSSTPGAGAPFADLDLAMSAVSRLLERPSDDLSGLRSLLATGPDHDTLREALGALLMLPSLAVPALSASLVLARLPDSAVDAVGAAIARRSGRVIIADLGEGWAGLRLEDRREDDVLLARAAGLMLRGRGILSPPARVLELWRADDGGCGVDVRRDDIITASMSWGPVWETPASNRPIARDHLSEEFTAVDGIAVDDASALREFFRSSESIGDPLVTLVPLLGLPDSALAALDRTDASIPERAVHPTGSVRRVWETLRRPGIPSSREVVVLAGVGTVMLAVALITGLMSALGIAVLVTDGAVIDQAGTTPSDGWFVLLFSVLTIVSGALGAAALFEADSASW